MPTLLKPAHALSTALILLTLSLLIQPVHAAPAVDPKTVAEVDAGLGPCTADFIITDEDGKPVYAANIRVHITYGFMNLHKFDLQVGTNADGKARFIGLPETSKQGFFFRASEGDREGSAFDNPAKTCKTQFTIALRKKPR
jgi:hypothetical protein